MKKYIFSLVTLGFLVTTCFAAQPKNTLHISSQVNSHIDQILKEQGENLNIGILIKDVNTGKIVYKKNIDRYFMPASSQKLFTAHAALNYLGPNFVYQTYLFADLAKVQNGILNDDVYLKFSGDPTFTYEQLARLVGALAQAGIKQINGNFIVDDSAFDQVLMSPGTTWDDKTYCWGSPISAIILDHNCVNAVLMPSTVLNQPINVTLPNNKPQFVTFANRALTFDNSFTTCLLNVTPLNDTTYAIDGCMRASEQFKTLSMAVNNPRKYLQSAIQYLLNQNHITNKQGVRFEKMNSPLKLLAYESSQPVSVLVNTMLKESDNTIANALFKTMGAFYASQAGSWQNGHRAMHYILLQTAQLDVPDTVLVDGAGASRYNFVTPQQMVTLLTKAYLSRNARLFVSSLPVSGLDGTLKERMKSPSVMGKVHAKTGTATAVSSLSGYLETRNKRLLAFTIMINGFVDMPTKYRQIEDKICSVLVEDD